MVRENGATPNESEPSPFMYVFYREETIIGPMKTQRRLKPSVWGGLDIVTEMVQNKELIGYAFRLATDFTFEHNLIIPTSQEIKLIFYGMYRIKSNAIEFAISDGRKLSGFLRADGREMLVEENVYTLLR